MGPTLDVVKARMMASSDDAITMQMQFARGSGRACRASVLRISHCNPAATSLWRVVNNISSGRVGLDDYSMHIVNIMYSSILIPSIGKFICSPSAVPTISFRQGAGI